MINQLSAKLLSLFLRHFPLDGGRWRLIPTALRLVTSLPADMTRTVTTRDGFRMRVRLGDWLGRHVYACGEYEPATARVFKSLLRPGATFLDVGANAGYFSLLASRCVGPTGRVWAFEPVPVTREELSKNVRLNGFQNVRIFEQAISNTPGTASFSVGPTDHRGTSSLRELTDGSATLTVETARLDDLLQHEPDASAKESGAVACEAGSEERQKVDLIKIDIEGAEYLALQGMTECLKRDRPDLVIEVTDQFLRVMGHSAEELCWMLADLGYHMYRIEHTSLVAFEPGQAAGYGQYNALFTTREKLPANLEVTRQVGQTCASSI